MLIEFSLPNKYLMQSIGIGKKKRTCVQLLANLKLSNGWIMSSLMPATFTLYVLVPLHIRHSKVKTMLALVAHLGLETFAFSRYIPILPSF
jgi:hypothetical protein